MASLLIVSAREKGGDPETNPRLRIAIEQAKKVNMPKENIERAIKKGTGELAGESLEEFTFEAFGPDKTALIIEGITDNKKRSLAEIKQILNQYNGKLAGEGSVKWMFDRKGAITIDQEKQNIKDKEDLEMTVIEAEAEDLSWNENILRVYTSVDDLEKVKKALEEKNIETESASLDWVAKEKVESSKESVEKLFEALDNNDSVQNIYSNIKI